MKDLLYSISQDDSPAVLGILKDRGWDGNYCVPVKTTSVPHDDNRNDAFCHPLIEAVRCGSLGVLAALVENFPSMSVDTIAYSSAIQQETSPLHMACRNKDTQALHLLLRAHANPNLVHNNNTADMHDNNQKNSALQFPPLLSLIEACPQSLACRRLLLQFGADPNATFHKGHTLLHWDCLKPSIRGAALLLEFGADANRKPPHGTGPSHIAYWTRNLDLGQLLKRHGATFGAFYEIEMYQTIEAYVESGDANVDDCPFDGLGLLHVCAYSLASVDPQAADHLVQVALRCGVNLNLPCHRERSPTPLMVSCGIGNAALSLAILEHCPNAHASVDDQGCTSIFYAVGSIVNTQRIMERLVEVGAELNAQSSLLSRTALHEGALFYYTDPKNLRSLIHLGADLNAGDDKGWTALHYSCLPALEGNRTSMRLLLDEGADVNAMANNGWTPLHLCSMDIYRNERRAMVRLPVEPFGPPWLPRPAGGGIVPMDVLQQLIQSGADPVAVDNEGNLPFFYLCHQDDLNTSPRDVHLLSSILVLVQAASHRGLFGWQK